MNSDEFFDTLAEVEQEAVEQEERTIVASEVKDLEDLDSLLKESLEIQSSKSDGERYRQQLKRGGMSKEETALIEQKLQEWESRREWQTVANVALFRNTTCSCGNWHSHFVGLYYRQVHRTLPNTKRLVAAKQNLNDVVVTAEIATIPNEVLHETRETSMCAACAISKGFNIYQSKEADWNAKY